jgi:hypothetical protein
MKKMKENSKQTAKWALQATGIVLAYFGAFALLMYPVIEAAGPLA